MEIDLTYEGIATYIFGLISALVYLVVEIDLTYEGIATTKVLAISLSLQPRGN